MAAPRGATFTAPPSSAIAGRVFTGMPGTSQAYNQYLQANARALGYRTYAQQSITRRQFRYIFRQEKTAPKYGAAGKLSPQHRTDINRMLAESLKESGKPTFRTPQGKLDRSIGGPMDLFLRKLGRRNGTETWQVGETNH